MRRCRSRSSAAVPPEALLVLVAIVVQSVGFGSTTRASAPRAGFGQISVEIDPLLHPSGSAEMDLRLLYHPKHRSIQCSSYSIATVSVQSTVHVSQKYCSSFLPGVVRRVSFCCYAGSEALYGICSCIFVSITCSGEW